jgi:hypothetical protein
MKRFLSLTPNIFAKTGALAEESLSAIRQASATEAVISLQRRSVERGTDGIGMEEIDAEIEAVRRKRRR